MGFRIGANCKIHPSVHIQVDSGFIGAGSVINEGARLEGNRIEIGREAFIDRYATIGGGSCFDPNAYLVAGDWFHMGTHSQVNIARGVKIGHEVGCGIETKIFTHGAYIDAYALGAPVQWAPVVIGDNVWLPNAWINPGVKIGSNVVVSARSMINKDVPGGALAGGAPCQILKENYLPRQKSAAEKEALVQEIFDQTLRRLAAGKTGDPTPSPLIQAFLKFDLEKDLAIIEYQAALTSFDLKAKKVGGAVTVAAVLFKDQLRRNGIRFRYGILPDSSPTDAAHSWLAWGDDPLVFFSS